MTAQLALALDVPAPDADLAAIVAAAADELDRERAQPVPDDEPNRRARGALIAGQVLLLDWLLTLDTLPAAWRDWPCSVCLAGPGQPCDIPNRYRRDSWLRPDRDELHHLGRGLDGRWANRLPGGRP